VVKEKAYSTGKQAAVRCYGADDVREGVAIMHLEGVDVAITGNSTNPTRFQHPVMGVYKKNACWQGRSFFLSLPAVEQEERFIQTTWPQDRHLTA